MGLSSTGATVLTGLGSGVINSLFGGLMARRQMQYQKDLYKYQYDMQQRAIQLQNEYNSPAQQVERLKEAGLNPNLIYGNGGSKIASTQTAFANPQLQGGANFQAIQSPLAGLSSLMDLFIKRQQLESLRNDNERKMMDNFGFKQDNYLWRLVQPGDWYTQDQLNRNIAQYASNVKLYFPHAVAEHQARHAQFLTDLYGAKVDKNGKRIPGTGVISSDIDMAKAFRQHLLSGFQNTVNQNLINYQRAIQEKKVNDWFETDKWFNMIDRGLGTLSNFIPNFGKLFRNSKRK